ncbi:L-serine ammonia-lyase, iron-sulfur-dependent, subunit alpha [Clostridium sp. Marseille-P299]|uniref:L-serine ammonia-lyase, iron-sulfur-dependent, subunit alpha n=1 Tax=Clostridium sp. Marseille-P299 TaxID=1805477 RepID=UPI000832DA8B|nr:L-serine ammonia-lyase, iron-sulfur-dependent, subunit alpha [Clostridium sp. Marseille-P299]
MSFNSVESILKVCKKENIHFAQAIRKDDCEERGVDEKDSKEKMKLLWQAMLEATASYDKESLSASGLVGKEGGLMEEYRTREESLCGDFVSKVISRALQMGGSNACMKRIVAAPTAGACGVLPAVLTSLYEDKNLEIEQMLDALYVSAGMGQVIASRAFISGAAGGCQAEIGSASAMAAAALVSLKGGDNEQIANASAMALKNLLGLVCDPVGGLVEVPCVKRNVIGAVNALAAADMALAGIKSAIPVDQVIDAMRSVGESMDASLRETGFGGLAATPKAREIVRQMKQKR